MQTRKFSHMKGRKIIGIVLAIIVLGLIGFIIYLFSDPYLSIDLLSLILLLVAVGSIVWLTYKLYKPAFTDIMFTEEGIISKTHFETEELRLEDIKGIWFLRNPQEDADIEEYLPGKQSAKGALIIIGDIYYFNGAEYFGANGANILHDSFQDGYTTIYNRRGLEDVLDFYYNKIQAKAS